MIAVNNKILCENCFMEIRKEPCPYCGFDVEKEAARDAQVLKRGSTLDNGRYIIGDIIGRGGFGITYLAYDTKLEKRIALKEYYPKGIAERDADKVTVTSDNDEENRAFHNGADRFFEEAKTLSRFNGNKYIVSVNDFFSDNDTVYFTMGYLSGETLKTYLKEKGRITEGQAAKLLDNISSALNITHAEGVLHRDISPDNIMLCDDGTIKLIDFGAARQVKADMPGMTVLLKHGYAPLEQYMTKGKVGPWTDIYALGATVYRAVTGEDMEDALSRREDDSAMKKNRQLFSDGLWRIVEKSTRLDIADRYQDISELKKDLRELERTVMWEDFPIEPVKPDQPAESGKPEEKTEPEAKPENKDDNETVLIDQDDTDGGKETELIRTPEDDVRDEPEDKHEDDESDHTDDNGGNNSDFMKKNRRYIIAACGIVAVLLIFIVVMVTKNKSVSDTEAEGEVVAEEETTALEEETEKEAAADDTDVEEDSYSEEALPDEIEEAGDGAVASGVCGENATWTLDDEGTLTISGSGDISDFEFDNVDAKTPWWENRADITKLVIEDGITSIGAASFWGFSNLTSVDIADSVTSIGNLSFQNCDLLENVELPASLTELGPRVFFSCDKLKEISISQDNKDFKVVDSVVFDENMTKLYCYPAGKEDTAYEVPDTVTELFTGCFAFAQNLTSVTLPEGLKYIDADVFRDCSNISELDIPSTVERISEAVFKGWGNKTLNFAGSAPEFHDDTFRDLSGDLFVNYKKSADWPHDKLRPYGGTVYWRENVQETIPKTGVTVSYGTRGIRDFNNLFDGDESTEWLVNLSEAAQTKDEAGVLYGTVEVLWKFPETMTPKSVRLSTGTETGGSIYDADGLLIKMYDEAEDKWETKIISKDELKKEDRSGKFDVKLGALDGEYTYGYLVVRMPYSEETFHLTEIEVR
ncbi:MAG: leucine-rich repeat protein [Lachnospiraceae bacterium]|nr:leucine-rich repeat protein [Lachnospiraceae bacterium]